MSTGQSAREKSLAEFVDILQEHKNELAQQYPIKSLGVFGSFARGESGSESDIDLLVEFYSPPTLFEFVRLQNELSDRLGATVDLVMKSALKPAIGARILQEVVTV